MNRELTHVPVLDGQTRFLGVLDVRDGLRALVARARYNKSLLRDYIMGIGYR